MDHRLTPEQKDALIEDALHAYPLAPIPRDISANVMAHIKQTSMPRPFQLTWQDVALALALSICVGAILFSLQNFPPIMLVHLRIQGILFYQDLAVNARWLVPSAMFGFATLLTVATIPYFQKHL